VGKNVELRNISYYTQVDPVITSNIQRIKAGDDPQVIPYESVSSGRNLFSGEDVPPLDAIGAGGFDDFVRDEAQGLDDGKRAFVAVDGATIFKLLGRPANANLKYFVL